MLPNEILLYIFEYLPPSSLISVSICSQKFYHLTYPLLLRSPQIDSLKKLMKLSSNRNVSSIRNLILHLQPLTRKSLELSCVFKEICIATHLHTLDISFCKGISNLDLKKLAPYLSNLVSLNVSGGFRDDKTVLSLLRSCSGSLLHLSVAWNPPLTDASLILIASYCTKLQSLDLSGCLVSDFGVLGLSRNFKDLVYNHGPVNLKNSAFELCDFQSSNVIYSGSSPTLKLVSLKRLNVSSCTLVSHTLISHLKTSHPTLEIGCFKI